MGRRTTIFNHREVGKVVRGWGISAWKLEQRGPTTTSRTWEYWDVRLRGHTAFTLEDLIFVFEVARVDPADGIVELREAFQRGNPGRIPGTLVQVAL